MDITIFTGAKGGIGKTLSALSAICSQPTDARVLIVDLNWTNPDISRIITRFGQNDAYRWDTLMFWRWKNPNVRWYTARPIYPYALPTTPDHIWGVVLQAIRTAEEKIKVTPDLVIVDTTLHPGNFIPYQNDVPDALTHTLEELHQKHNVTNLYIWFLWTLSALKNTDGVKAIGGASLNLNKVFGDAFPIDGFQQGRSLSTDAEGTLDLRVKNLIHVLNPEAIYPQRVIVRLFTDRFRRMFGLGDSEDFEEDEPIIIPELYDLATARVRADVISVGDMHKQIRDMSNFPERPSLETMYKTLAENIKATYQNARPINLYPIPEISGKLRGYTEEFGTSYEGEIRNPSELLQTIAPVFKYLKCYINGHRYTPDNR